MIKLTLSYWFSFVVTGTVLLLEFEYVRSNGAMVISNVNKWMYSVNLIIIFNCEHENQNLTWLLALFCMLHSKSRIFRVKENEYKIKPQKALHVIINLQKN